MTNRHLMHHAILKFQGETQRFSTTTVDERPARLTQRQETLTQRIELLILDGRKNTRNIAELSRTVAEVSKTVSAANKTVSQMAVLIDTRGRIAGMHEHTLDKPGRGIASALKKL